MDSLIGNLNNWMWSVPILAHISHYMYWLTALYVLFIGSGLPVDRPCLVRTRQGPCCAFPFIYWGKKYSQCLPSFFNGLWCSLTSNYDQDGTWGHCLVLGSYRPRKGTAWQQKLNICKLSNAITKKAFIFIVQKSKECKQHTTSGECCFFPFIYRGKKYSTCISFNHDRPWCSLTSEYDNNSKWGNCAGYCK